MATRAPGGARGVGRVRGRRARRREAPPNGRDREYRRVGHTLPGPLEIGTGRPTGPGIVLSTQVGRKGKSRKSRKNAAGLASLHGHCVVVDWPLPLCREWPLCSLVAVTNGDSENTAANCLHD